MLSSALGTCPPFEDYLSDSDTSKNDKRELNTPKPMVPKIRLSLAVRALESMSASLANAQTIPAL
jgi:hypothetical protein